MSLYNLLFGQNPQSSILLAVVGLKKCDVERFRDVYASGDGSEIDVYTRTGGGNRADYPQAVMRHAPGWQTSVDDDFDSTYCTDTFSVSEKFRDDVAKLSKILEHGIRPEFARHLAKTLHREPNERDQAAAAYASEQASLERTNHFKANGYMFVPKSDAAMRQALDIAEANGGKLRTLSGPAPLKLQVQTNYSRFESEFHRVHVDYVWEVDEDYHARCVDQFSETYPVAMKRVSELVEQLRKRGAS